MNSRIRTPFYIFFLNPVYVAARSLRSLRSNKLVFHMGVNSIRADESSPLVPMRCLLSLVTNGNLTLLFFYME